MQVMSGGEINRWTLVWKCFEGRDKKIIFQRRNTYFQTLQFAKIIERIIVFVSLHFTNKRMNPRLPFRPRFIHLLRVLGRGHKYSRNRRVKNKNEIHEKKRNPRVHTLSIGFLTLLFQTKFASFWPVSDRN